MTADPVLSPARAAGTAPNGAKARQSTEHRGRLDDAPARAGLRRTRRPYSRRMTGQLTPSWRRDLHQRPTTLITRARDHLLVVAERRTRMVRLDPMTGAVLWETRLGDPWGRISLGEDSLAYRDQQAELTIFRTADGQAVWSRKVSRNSIDHLTVCSTAIVTGGWRGYEPVRGLSTSDGSTLWTAPLLRTRELDGEQVRPMAFGQALLGSRLGSQTLWLLDASKGKILEKWRLPEPITTGSDGPDPFQITPDGGVLFRTGARTVHHLDPAGELKVIWVSPSNLDSSPALPDGELLWLRHPDGLSCANPDTGRQDRVITDQQAQIVGLHSHNDYLLAALRDGRCYLIHAGNVVDRIYLPRPLAGLETAAPHLAHVLTKGEIVTLVLPQQHTQCRNAADIATGASTMQLESA